MIWLVLFDTHGPFLVIRHDPLDTAEQAVEALSRLLDCFGPHVDGKVVLTKSGKTTEDAAHDIEQAIYLELATREICLN